MSRRVKTDKRCQLYRRGGKASFFHLQTCCAMTSIQGGVWFNKMLKTEKCVLFSECIFGLACLYLYSILRGTAGVLPTRVKWLRIFSHHPNLDIGWLDSYQLNITNTAIRSFSLTSEPHPHSQSQSKRSNRVNSEARTHRIQLIYISLFTALGRGKIVNTLTHEYYFSKYFQLIFSYCILWPFVWLILILQPHLIIWILSM